MEVVTLGHFSSFEIRPIGKGLYDVIMDGEKLKGVTAVNIDMSTECIPSVTIKMMAGSIDATLTDGHSMEVT